MGPQQIANLLPEAPALRHQVAEPCKALGKENMDEHQWLTAPDPHAMLNFLRSSGHLRERKARLFAVACCRRIWHLLKDERSRKVIELAERQSDALFDHTALAVAYDDALAVCPDSDVDDGSRAAANAAAFSVEPHSLEAALSASTAAYVALATHTTATVPGDNPRTETTMIWEGVVESEQAAQACLLRDIFGNFFRPLPTVPPPVRAWNDGVVVKLATAAYQEPELPSGHLDQARHAVLADALEEAGCTDQDILGHLRAPGLVHVRGCHVLDLLLGKS